MGRPPIWSPEARCSECKKNPISAKGLCQRCYQRQNERERYARDPAFRAHRQELARQAYHRKIAKDPGHRAVLAAKMNERAHTPGGVRYRREYNLQKYGLTIESRDAILAAQSGRCAICPNVLDVTKPKGCHVDHDHKTGRVRGLLCSGCNIGLGHFRDNPALLRAGAVYLERCA